MNSGSVILIPPNVKVSTNFNNCKYYGLITFNGNLSRLSSIFNKPIKISTLEQEILYDLIYTGSQLKEFSGKTNDYLINLLSSILLRFNLRTQKENSSLFFNQTKKTSTHIDSENITSSVKQYLDERIYDFITLEDLSRYFGISKNKLMKDFKNATGISIMQYFTKLKIDKAISLITETDLSFRSISEKLAFSSPEYFSKVFKKEVGLTLTEFSITHPKWQGCLNNTIIF